MTMESAMKSKIANLTRETRAGSPLNLVQPVPHAWRDGTWYWRYGRPTCGA